MSLFVPVPVHASTTDLALRAGAETSYLSAVDAPGDGSLLLGARLFSQLRSSAPRASYRLGLGGFAGSTLPLAEGAGRARGTYSLNLSPLARWELGPRSGLLLDGGGFLASRLAVRSTDRLAARDPFLQDRVEYAVDPGLGLSYRASPRHELRTSAAYVGSGGLSSDSPEAVGVDTHGARALVVWDSELGPRTRLQPEVRWSYTHFRHALLDTSFRRGEADVYASTLGLRLLRAQTSRLELGALGGLTVSTPPPILNESERVLTPEAQAQATFRGEELRAQALYSYGFTSLGPRLGYGSQHRGALLLSHRPLPGAAHRDLRVRGGLTLAYGEAPVETALLTLPTAGLPPRGKGLLQSLTAVGGVRVDVPLRRRLFLTGGYDLQLTQASFEPRPPTGQPGAQLNQTLSLALSGLWASDPAEPLSLDALGELEEEPRAPGGEGKEGEGGEAPEGQSLAPPSEGAAPSPVPTPLNGSPPSAAPP